MVIKHIYEGGFGFMAPIVAIWVAVLGLSVYGFAKLFVQKQSSPLLEKNTNLILFLGIFAFLLGLLAQVVGLVAAFETIEAIGAEGDISPSIVAGGLRVSFIAPVYGFLIFVLSLVFWFVKRNYLLPRFSAE